jgi:hypothetical protein
MLGEMSFCICEPRARRHQRRDSAGTARACHMAGNAKRPPPPTFFSSAAALASVRPGVRKTRTICCAEAGTAAACGVSGATNLGRARFARSGGGGAYRVPAARPPPQPASTWRSRAAPLRRRARQMSQRRCGRTLWKTRQLADAGAESAGRRRQPAAPAPRRPCALPPSAAAGTPAGRSGRPCSCRPDRQATRRGWRGVAAGRATQECCASKVSMSAERRAPRRRPSAKWRRCADRSACQFLLPRKGAIGSAPIHATQRSWWRTQQLPVCGGAAGCCLRGR